MQIKNVGEMIDYLSKFPRETKFVKYTEGYYCIHKETDIHIMEDNGLLSSVWCGKVICEEGTGETRLQIYH